MKKSRLAAAVSVAVLSMSMQVMAAPQSCNISSGSNCPTSNVLANFTGTNCQSLDSALKNCLTSVNIESILSQLNCTTPTSVKGATTAAKSSNCTTSTKATKAMKATKATKSTKVTPSTKCATATKATTKTNCTTGSNCAADTSCTGTNCATGTTCTGSDCATGTTCTGSNCTTGSTNSGSTNTGSTNSGSANTGSTNSGSVNNGSQETPAASVSAYAQAVVNLVNEERADAGLSPLKIDTKVVAAAQVRAKEVQTTFSHTRPDGRSCFTALDEAGASYRGAGENIALGQKTPEQVMNGWMNSEGHRANILNPNFKYIGVGVDGNAWTQLFTY